MPSATAIRSRLGTWLAGLALLGGVAILGATSGCGGDEPALVVSPTHHDFGRVRIGHYPRMKVSVRNTTSQAVTIKAAKPSCGCLRITPGWRQLVEAGGTTEIPIEFVSNYGPPTKIRGKTLKISTDGDHGVTHVAFDAITFAPYRLEPRQVGFGLVDVDAPQSRNVKVLAERGYGVRLDRELEGFHEGVHLAHSQFFTATARDIPGGVSVDVTPRKDAEGAPGLISSTVSVALWVKEEDGSEARAYVTIDMKAVWPAT